MLVTWWGHSSATVQWGSQRLLFDPVLRNSVAHPRRRRGPTPPPSASQADAVFISHLHADHCHVPSLRLLSPNTVVIGPAGIAGFLRRYLGRSTRCQELVDGDEVTVGDLVVRALYAEHDDRRSPVSSYRAQPLSFLVVTPGSAATGSLWFGGDTGLHDGLATLAPVGVALVPVGGWGPGLGPGHLDGEQAATAVGLMSARVAIPIHYGTFWPRGLDWLASDQFLGPERRFDRQVREVSPQTVVHILSPGQTLDITAS